jgi:AraC-like DNA-binding protein
MDLEYKSISPSSTLSPFVESFWMLANLSEETKPVTVLPDGRFDIFFSYSATEPYHVTILGLENGVSQSSLSPKSVIFAISFKLLACEYLLDINISSLLNKASYLPNNFLNTTHDDIGDFDKFCDKVSRAMNDLIKADIDNRKKKLFELIYSTQGALTVQEMSERVHWSSRQINRYFTNWFGLSLKTYCNILRFRASFTQINAGKLFPEQNFTDQAHFIKEVKKYSGVAPKALTKNKDDRFIQFSVMKKK